MTTEIENAAGFFWDNDNFVLGIHANPDGDCFGSACALCGALRKIGKSCVILSPSTVPERLKFLNYENVPVYEGKSGYDNMPFSVGQNYRFAAIDVASGHLLGELEPIFNEKNEIVVDHHEKNTLSAKLFCVDKNASAAGEIVFKIILRLEELTQKQIFDKNTASAVYGAVASDTGCFKYSNVTAETHEIASKLIRYGTDNADIAYRLFDLKSPVQIAVEALSYDKLEYFFDGRLSFIYLSDEELDKIGATASDTETVAQIGRGINGVQIAAYMRKKEVGVFKVSVRSNNNADMSLLCAGFDVGGGHKKAAGCSIFAKESETAKKIFLERAKSFLE